MEKSIMIDSGSESGMTKSVKTLSTCSKAGFTLAEVLITLGIIGVVAVMTIPNLMTNYRKHVIETRLVKFYSTINQAIKLAEYDHDDMSGWDDLVGGFVKDEDGNDTDTPMAYVWVMKYIVPYLKSDAKKIGTDSQYVNLYFMDGSMVSVNRSSWIFFPDSSKYEPEMITAAGQIPVVGKYAFLFIFKPELDNRQNYKYLGQGLQPYKFGWDGTREDLLNGTYGCGKAGVIGAYCTELIRQNGWRIPNDYPIKL